MQYSAELIAKAIDHIAMKKKLRDLLTLAPGKVKDLAISYLDETVKYLAELQGVFPEHITEEMVIIYLSEEELADGCDNHFIH